MIILVSFATMSLCLLLQVVCGIQAVRYFSAARRRPHDSFPVTAKFIRLCLLMILLMIGIVMQMTIWALLFHFLDAFGTFEEALYFSGVTFTSLGYGDLVLKPPIRLLAPLEAANGLTMFAVVTGILVGALRDWTPASDDAVPSTIDCK